MYYMMIEIPGIQAYITASGKLKEMVGGSHIINLLTGPFLSDVIKGQGLSKVGEPETNGAGWYWPVQNAAATIRAVVATKDEAVTLMKSYTLRVRKEFPGIPVLGAISQFTWDNSHECLEGASNEVKQKIAEKRANGDPVGGLNLLPFCQAAPLDGEPVATIHSSSGSKEPLSRASYSKSEYAQHGNRALTEEFAGDLKTRLAEELGLEQERLPDLKWALDYEEMFSATAHSHIGILHLDGNDLGNTIQKKLSDAPGGDALSRNRMMQEFSKNLDDCNNKAFAEALFQVVSRDLRMLIKKDKGIPGNYVLPVRPLIIGGDDLTAVIRADLALIFAACYADSFHSASNEEKLSVSGGMLICNHRYPFTRAYHIVEQLTDNAKGAGRDNPEQNTWLDFHVTTTEVDDDLDNLRQRLYQSGTGELLTAKPLKLTISSIQQFLADLALLHNEMPASQLRRAVDGCRSGKKQADQVHLEIRENMKRGLGGRHDSRLMEVEKFRTLFDESSFFSLTSNGKHPKQYTTRLLDLYEMKKFIQEEI